jgi:hypothetical protein
MLLAVLLAAMSGGIAPPPPPPMPMPMMRPQIVMPAPRGPNPAPRPATVTPVQHPVSPAARVEKVKPAAVPEMKPTPKPSVPNYYPYYPYYGSSLWPSDCSAVANMWTNPSWWCEQAPADVQCCPRLFLVP